MYNIKVIGGQSFYPSFEAISEAKSYATENIYYDLVIYDDSNHIVFVKNNGIWIKLGER